MSFLDSIKGLAEGQDAAGGNGMLAAVGGMIQQAGGIGGLISTLRQGGLGELVDSWVGTGSNRSVSGSQLAQALAGTAAGQHVEAIAQKMGVDPAQVFDQLAQHLPNVIDHVTPNGQVPADGGSEFNLGELSGLATKLGL